MNTKFPFKIDLSKMDQCVRLEEIEGYTTDYEDGLQKIRLFVGSKEVTLIVKERKIYDPSGLDLVGEYS